MVALSGLLLTFVFLWLRGFGNRVVEGLKIRSLGSNSTEFKFLWDIPFLSLQPGAHD